jgi:phosphoribosylformimino-5-aminoimidazole carboxamide ribotide isomerase
MLIPSIDLQGGRVVQLVQGEELALSYDDPAPWIEKFRRFPIVQLIDLDAAKGVGNNRNLIRTIAAQLPVQLGGGVRTPAQAAEMLALGAQKVIVGSALYDAAAHAVREDVVADFAKVIGIERLIFGIDARDNKIAVHGWKTLLDLTPGQAIAALEPHCGGFLYTHIDAEGTLQGFPLERARSLAAVTPRQLIVAGGIRSRAEVEALHALSVDAVVGMAIYQGLMDVAIRSSPG